MKERGEKKERRKERKDRKGERSFFLRTYCTGGGVDISGGSKVRTPFCVSGPFVSLGHSPRSFFLILSSFLFHFSLSLSSFLFLWQRKPGLASKKSKKASKQLESALLLSRVITLAAAVDLFSLSFFFSLYTLFLFFSLLMVG